MSKDVDLYRVWIQQGNYNDRIKERQKRTQTEWMINYILGAHSELSELLDQLRWKAHRQGEVDLGPNLTEELADVTKYVFSMWELLGFTPQQMLDAVHLKGELLEQLLRQETAPEWTGRRIIMLDLDGVIADFRTGFEAWLRTSKWSESLPITNGAYGLHMDLNNGWDYNIYNEAKLQFEQDGGYNTLPYYDTMISAIRRLRQKAWVIIVYTARPYREYRRIWGDTWRWLQRNNLKVDELNFGYDTRITRAKKLSQSNMVIAVEDDPTLIQRYVGCNIPVCISPQPYNRMIPSVPLVYHVMENEPDWAIETAIDNLFHTRSLNHVKS